MSIKQRITIWFAALVASLLLLFSLFIYQTYESYRRSLMRNRLQRRALAGQLYFQNRVEFHRSSYLTLPDQHETILGPANHVIYKSSGPDDHKLTKGLLAQARKGEVHFNYQARPWNKPKEGVALSFIIDGQRYVSVVTAYDLPGRQASNSLLFILFVGNIVLLVIVAFAGFWFARRSMRPFDQLIEQMNPSTANDFSFRLQSTSKADEVAYLAGSFNELLGRLQVLADSQEHFVAYASHEIRTPLTVVKGILETSIAYDNQLADTRISMEKALLRLEDAINLANSLLQLAEVEGLQSVKMQQDVNVVDTILDSISYFGEKHPDQQINFILSDTFTEKSQVIYVMGNSLLLRTVLINILDNASKYSGKKPVSLDVDLTGDQMAITVTDRGMGIPNEQIADIFMPMMRASNVGKIPGFGLGLTIAKKIIDMHQGTLEVDSKSNQTTVSIRLPASTIQA
ncbi:signal transduction histidine kinase [Dyadobacter sp. BE34]|uniref:histidine kinase n=1 Tax=Dyadobacter fermentans TaxID=94254 RepID=A0ABU1R875_9BACT|nr:MULTISPECIES: HAMP domain-containing sensor histidine kinase [Dyadobacter]MDR6809596.1 signal transduction histidine kinase [Dyadobacter fermentans]MDR7047274.1 signal transduction histidine kinase [Dyadobacter sp. BE242]MDR7201510.1 signal transduction histidine kinase [Dyadobacter sp. BE34]MDR7219380.1 signal transduction histidine kinase [Dyadobacter sp. BE31]MDR7267226.1 signal transduction histidine kinase [Dyadobacter sp. BE32]